VRDWQRFFWGTERVPSGFAEAGKPEPGGNLHVLRERQVDNGATREKASHGCFDNSRKIIAQTLETIRGAPLARPIGKLNY